MGKDFFQGFLIEVCFYFSHKIIFESSNFLIFKKVVLLLNLTYCYQQCNIQMGGVLCYAFNETCDQCLEFAAPKHYSKYTTSIANQLFSLNLLSCKQVLFLTACLCLSFICLQGCYAKFVLKFDLRARLQELSQT